jgi:hypothetical protein
VEGARDNNTEHQAITISAVPEKFKTLKTKDGDGIFLPQAVAMCCHQDG